jgi:hypothetical protein
MLNKTITVAVEEAHDGRIKVEELWTSVTKETSGNRQQKNGKGGN